MKKYLALVLVVIQLLVLLPGCSGAPKAAPTPGPAEVKARDTLRIGSLEEWVGADLNCCDTFYDAQMLIAEPLFLYNRETGELEGCMCTTPVFTNDGHTMTFEVPDGRTFPNGKTLDAQDIKASLEYAIKNGAMSDTLGIITNVQVDGKKVICTLKEYSTALLILLVSPFFCVIDSEQLATTSKEALLWGAVPFGPYYITQYVEGGSVTLKRNPGFKTLNPNVQNKGPAQIENIVVSFVSDEFNAISAMRTKEFDFIINLTADGQKMCESMTGVTVNSTLPPMVRNLCFNTSDPFLKDPNVRLAIMLLIDRDNIVSAFGGAAKPAYSYITQNVMYHTAETEDYFKSKYANDKARAMKLLADAGFKDANGDSYLERDGKQLTLDFVAETGKNTTAAQAIQIQLQQAGIKVNLESLATGATQRQQEKKYSIAICSYWWSEPGRFLVRCWKDHNNFDETEITALAKQVETTTDNTLRFKLVDQAQRVIMDTQTLIPLYTTTYIKAYYTDIGNPVFITDGLFLNDCH